MWKEHVPDLPSALIENATGSQYCQFSTLPQILNTTDHVPIYCRLIYCVLSEARNGGHHQPMQKEHVRDPPSALLDNPDFISGSNSSFPTSSMV